MAWGSAEPEVIVLGFSKGLTQSGALAEQPHDQIAFRGGRTDLAKILHHVGLIEEPKASLVDRIIADQGGRFHFGSFVRCTVKRRDARTQKWAGTGGGMLDKFVATSFGRDVVTQCVAQFLGTIPASTKLILMLGMGTKGNYIKECRQAYGRGRPGSWKSINEVSYGDGDVVVVHTEHFKSQGALIPNWLSGEAHPRGRLGLLAKEAVRLALSKQR